MSVRNACMMLTLIVCLAAICGCTASDEDVLPQDIYVAVEEHQVTSCSIIEGSYSLPPHITLPPVFIYDGSLKGSDPVGQTAWEYFSPGGLDNYYPAANNSLKVLFGSTYYREVAPSDTRTGITVKGVYSFPYVGQSGFVLQNVDSNGTVYGSYNNTSVILKIGERWVTPASTETRAGNGTGTSGKPFNYTASFSTAWSITNLGMFDKANLTRYNNSATDTGYTMLF